MVTKSKAPEEQPFSPVVAAVLTQMFTDSANVTNTLLDNYRREIRELRAELAAVRTGVGELLSGPYAPSESAIQRAVYFPPNELVQQFIEAEEAREHAV